MDLNSLTVRQIAAGYSDMGRQGVLQCHFCGAQFDREVVYPVGELLFTAEKAVKQHIAEAHGDVLDLLLGFGKGTTGVSEIQASLIRGIRDGLSDAALAKKLGGKALSTIRNHRFQLRKKRNEAKIFLAIMALLERKEDVAMEYFEFQADMTVRDDRTQVTKAEAEAVRDKYLRYDDGLKMDHFPKKQKTKLILLQYIVQEFESGREYLEKEINDTLKAIYFDYVTLRRYLVDYGFLKRKADGSAYWR